MGTGGQLQWGSAQGFSPSPKVSPNQAPAPAGTGAGRAEQSGFKAGKMAGELGRAWELRARLTWQVAPQRGQPEAGEGAVEADGGVALRAQQPHHGRSHSKEADEDGAQHAHDDKEDEEGGLGVDGGAHQAHKQTQQEHERAVEQFVPVAAGQDLGAGAHALACREKSRGEWGSRGRLPTPG